MTDTLLRELCPGLSWRDYERDDEPCLILADKGRALALDKLLLRCTERALAQKEQP